jgi:glyoxylase-like metal-dependent hydrolase (beta-lactamase superfamily II)
VRGARRSEPQPNRRAVLRGIAGGLAAASLPSSVAFGLDVLTDNATPGFLVLSGAGGNIVVLATSDGQIVVDSGNAQSSGDVVATLRPLGKIAALVNTHWHKDQTGSNEALGSAGATIVAHQNTRHRVSTGWYVAAEDHKEEARPPPRPPPKAVFETPAMQVAQKRGELG